MRLVSRVEINTQAREVKAQGKKFAKDFALQVGEVAQNLAKRNVAPGQGPGPHPHRPGSRHVDTGNLMNSITVTPQSRGFLEASLVGTDVDYGVYLEYGWTSKAGNHWRYPWLYPAVMEARASALSVARSTSRRWFHDDIGSRIDAVAPISSTWQAE